MPHGAWPPASPWIWQDSSWDSAGGEHAITISVFFDANVAADGTAIPSGTLALQHVDYDVDAGCPWRYILVDRADGTRFAFKVPDGGRTGSIGVAALNSRGFNTFNDIGQITAGATNSLTKQ